MAIKQITERNQSEALSREQDLEEGSLSELYGIKYDKSLLNFAASIKISKKGKFISFASIDAGQRTGPGFNQSSM